MTIQLTVNSFASLENILEQISAATSGKVELSVVRKGLFKNEISISVHPQIKEVKIYAKKAGTTSKFYCVYYDKSKKAWNYKFVHKKQKYYGRGFKTELEAARAYNNHVVKIKGLDAILNVIESA